MTSLQADYDSQGNSIQIWLEDSRDWDSDDVLLNGGVIVSRQDRKPVLVEIHGASEGLEEPVAAASTAYGLDSEALLAAAEAALAAPDRTVRLLVERRIAVS